MVVWINWFSAGSHVVVSLVVVSCCGLCVGVFQVLGDEAL